MARHGHGRGAGGAFSIPGGIGVVEGDEIRIAGGLRSGTRIAPTDKLDPEIKCFMPGIRARPTCSIHSRSFRRKDKRALHVRIPSATGRAHEHAGEEPGAAWMDGRSGMGRESLVVEVNDQMPDTWFVGPELPRDALKVTERYTAIDANTLDYEATIEDPRCFRSHGRSRCRSTAAATEHATEGTQVRAVRGGNYVRTLAE